jgi:hypothetical protein
MFMVSDLDTDTKDKELSKMNVSRETRKELFSQMTDFQIAIFFLLEGYDLGVALEKDTMSTDQRERFEKIEAAYIEEQLKDCPF